MPDTLQTSIELYDKVTAPTKNMVNALSKMLDVFKSLDSSIAGGLDMSALTSAERELNAIKATLTQTEQSAGQVSGEWNKMGDAVKQASVDTNALIGSLNGAAAAANNLKEPLTGLERVNRMNELNRLFRNAGQGAAEAATHVTAYASRLDKCNVEAAHLTSTLERMRSVQPLSGISADIEEFDIRVSLLKIKLSNLFSAIKPSNVFKQVSNQVLQLQWNISSAMHSMKQFASTKLSNLKSGLTGIKNTLTQGQTGAKGFVTALKNINKISVVKLLNGVKDLSRNLKTVAATNFSKLKSSISQVVSNIRQASKETTSFNSKLKNVSSAGSSLAGVFTRVAGAVGAAFGVSTIIKTSDAVAQTKARLDLMNDGMQTTQELQDKIFESAKRSRGAYLDTADAVSKMGILAGNAFSSNDEIIAFMEQVNKQFVISGTNTEGVQAAMLQLTQAMGSGVLRGEELNSVLEQAPTIVQSIAKYLGVSTGQLREMASEGQITSEVVKEALLGAAEETNAKFESMPKTFGQIWIEFKNNAIKAFQPLLEKINEIANSGKLEEYLQTATDFMVKFGESAMNALTWIMDNGDTVENALKIAAIAIAGLTVAMWAFNIACYANPLSWIVIVIIVAIAALVAALVAVILYWDEIKAAALSCWDAIKAAWGSIVEWFKGIWESVKGVWQSVVDWFKGLWQGVTEWFKGIWQSVTGFFSGIWNTVKSIFLSAWETIRPLVQAIADFISAVFELIGTVVSIVMNNIKNTIVNIWNAVVEFITPIINAIKDFIVTAWNAVKDRVSNAVTTLKDKVVSIWNAINDFIRPIIDGIKNFISSAWSAIKANTVDRLVETYDSIKNKFNEILDFIGNLKDQFVQKGKDIIQGLIDGITSKIQGVTSAIRNITSIIRGETDDNMGISSPSKVMMEKGRYITEGLAIGMENRLRDVKRAALSLSSAAGEYPKTTFGNRDTVTARGDYSDIRSAAGKSDKGETKTIVKAPITITINNDNEISSEMDLTDVIKRMSNGIYANLQSNLEANYGV